MTTGTCVDLIAAKGAKIFIGSALPATYDTAGYDAVTWTEIGMVESIGEFGPEHSIGSFTPIGTGTACKFMGTRDNGSIQLTVAKTATDSGLIAVLAHLGSVDNLPYMVQLSDYGTQASATDLWPAVATGAKATRYAFPGLTTSAKVSIGSGDDVTKLSVMVALNGDFTESAPANSTT